MNTALATANILLQRQFALHHWRSPIEAGELSFTVQKQDSSSTYLQFRTYIALLSP
jgi:hypothetical protein